MESELLKTIESYYKETFGSMFSRSVEYYFGNDNAFKTRLID